MTGFNGFPKELPQFLSRLEKNNTVEWFQDHKQDYETFVKHPSEEFVVAVGERLRTFCPGINAIPKVNKSLFRINRDIRFSNDKSPYKTNLGILFWEGPGKRMESSGFYFHLEGDLVMVGCGLYVFPKPVMQKFRETLMDKKKGRELQKIIEALVSDGYGLGTKYYKKIPAGFSPSSDFEKEYLLYSGLSAHMEFPIPDLLFSPEIVEFTGRHFEKMNPLQKWIVKYL
jgi:uncharacterized protein (TIGR02453 family)